LGQVDAVSYSTDSSWECEIEAMRDTDSCLPAQGQRNGLMAVLDDFGLNAMPYGVNFSACDNLGRSLSLARMFLMSEMHSNVLIVIGDKTEPDYSRFTLSGSALYSDFVGAFILSRDKPDGPSYHLENVSYQNECAVSKIVLKDGLRKMTYTKQILKKLKKKFMATEHSGREALTEYDKIIMGHYNNDFVESMCVLLDVDTSHVVSDYSTEYSHCYAINPIISLKNMADDDLIADGDTVLQLTSAAEMATLCGYRYCA